MSTANLNVSVGIDAGSHSSKLAADNKIIATLMNFNLLKIREEAEIYFDEPVFSCVIALSDDLDKRERENVIYNARKSGFKNIELISAHEAILNSVDNKDARVLAYDFGASRSEIILFDQSQVIDREVIKDVCGDSFDKIFASWLSERFSLNLIDENELMTRAENFKRELSANDFITWRGVEIAREDFERLIYFSVKRVSHTVERFLDCYEPDKVFIIGGCAEIPIVKKIFASLSSRVEFAQNLIALGAAKKANSLSSTRQRAKQIDETQRLSEIRGALMTLEDLLTRKQKDRLYALFRQTEILSANTPALISMLENLISEINSKGRKS